MPVRAFMLLLAVVGLSGCLQPEKARLQSGEDKERSPTRTVGEVTSFANANPIQVCGVGLVVGLDGTGGGMPPPSNYRDMLEHDLRKQGVESAKEILSNPNHAMVIVSALIPAGAKKGTPLDIEITLPPNSKTKSLRGGVLQECTLFNYESMKALSPGHNGRSGYLSGHALAKAAGPILVGFGDGDADAKLRQGRIWSGGRCALDRPFYLALNPGKQAYRTAIQIAERANTRFQGPFGGPGNSNLAEAKSKEVVFLNVPPVYQYNLPRYLRVVRLMPLDEMPAGSAYRRALADELLDPASTITAALRLEAIGTDALPALRQGLKSDHPLVRFAAAESLAYLNEPDAADELAQLAVEQPYLRSYCLTALASLDDPVSPIKLRELLVDATPETRYGAFRALSVIAERERRREGETINGAFVLHRAAPEAAPLVHVTTSGRAEIVLFGEEVFLQPPYSFLAGPEFTVTAGEDDRSCMISRFSLTQGTSRRQCGMKIEDVIRTMGELGASYADVIDLLRQADKLHCLNCQVAVDALPSAMAVEDIARAGSAAGDSGVDAEIIQARGSLNATPNLFSGPKKPTPVRAARTRETGTAWED